MTNERAIELLNRISDSQFDGPHGDERREALSMAVRALLSQQIVNDSQGLVNDCISRKMAIETVSNMFAVTATQKDMVEDCLEILENLPSLKFATDINVGDTIYRQAAIDAVNDCGICIQKIVDLPSAQPERDIPVKPIETTDKAWGIPHRQAVCPKCDYYLGHVAFLGDYKGKRITYCETCGQAIDWEGWDFDG